MAEERDEQQQGGQESSGNQQNATNRQGGDQNFGGDSGSGSSAIAGNTGQPDLGSAGVAERGQQPLDQQGNFGTQEPGLGNQTNQEYGSQGGQSATGEAQGGDTDTLSQNQDVGPGGYSPESGGSDLGGGETGLGDSGGSQQGQGGFVGSQGQDSGEYLQQEGNPQSGFAEQGRGASNEDEDNEGSGGK